MTPEVSLQILMNGLLRCKLTDTKTRIIGLQAIVYLSTSLCKVQTDGYQGYPPPLPSLLSIPHYEILLSSRQARAQTGNRMHIYITKQHVFVNCFKWSLLVLHNAHTLHHTNIACTGAPCIVLHMFECRKHVHENLSVKQLQIYEVKLCNMKKKVSFLVCVDISTHTHTIYIYIYICILRERERERERERDRDRLWYVRITACLCLRTRAIKYSLRKFWWTSLPWTG